MARAGRGCPARAMAARPPTRRGAMSEPEDNEIPTVGLDRLRWGSIGVLDDSGAGKAFLIEARGPGTTAAVRIAVPPDALPGFLHQLIAGARAEFPEQMRDFQP